MNVSWRVLFLITTVLVRSTAHSQVVISEFMADNKKSLADESGEYSDWIELYNSSGASVNLAGWALTDDPAHANLWKFPSTNVPANGFIVVFASGTNRAVLGQPLHASFKLSASGEYLALLKPDQSVASEFGTAYPAQYPDLSFGLAQNVTTNALLRTGASARFLIPTGGTLGNGWTQSGFNDSAWQSGPTAVGYESAAPGFAVRNYKASVSVGSLATALGVINTPAQQSAVYSENAATINYFNSGSPANYGNDRTFPGFSMDVDMDDFVVEATATITIPAAGNWTFGVNSDDGFSLAVGNFSMSYPDPRGPSDTLQTFNFPAAGEYPIHLVFYERGGGSGVELFAAPGSFTAWDPGSFRLVGDVTGGGLAVRAPVVSGGGSSLSFKSFIKTDVQAQMSGVNPALYLRVPFSVTTPSALQSLTLRMMYDDGFVAYINGQEVARRNAPATPQWNSAATAARANAQALNYEEINISDFLGTLLPGNNLLAIQGFNQTVGDSDFLLLPELVEYRVTNATTNYFEIATPGAPNGSGFVAFVGDTKFSVDHGFFTNAFTLAITSSTPGAVIRYTTDGSTPSLANGNTYSAPLTVSKTTVVRAAAFKTGFQPSNVDTKTYIFLSDVIRQSPNGETPPGWPGSWGGNTVDYGMDPNVVNNPLYSGTITNDLQTIPSFSIVTDLPNLFDPLTGIYANPSGDGITWERPASIELIYPDGTKGFHTRAGLRVRGGYSRSTGNPKHAFRFFFRDEYGDAKLKYPVFAKQNGADSFNGFDLRTFQNYSWSFEGDSRGIFLRDQFSRDTQIDMGQPGERGDYYHLYIDGQYWGLYNTDERAEASYAASYFGGNPEDYDVIKVDPGRGYNIFATDGTMEAWTRLWRMATNGFASDAAYQKAQGNNPDGTRNPAYEVLLDVDNLIDYMLVIFYGGNLDAPISNFLGNTSPNNWFGFRNTNGLAGFRFVAHDSEHTLLDVNQNRVGPWPAGDPNTGGGLLKSNPQYIFQQLWQNTEFKVRLADRIQKHFFNDGALTPAAAQARFMKRKNEIDRAVVGESARWGDSKREPPLTRNNEWLNEINRVANNYIPQRTGIVLNQLKAKSLYPNVAAPSFSQFGGNVTNGSVLGITASAGTIYYTRDGSDPRLSGGAISPGALPYNAGLPLTQSTRIKARALSGGVWSALVDATFYTIQDFSDVLITEIMYHPPDTIANDGNSFEFIELKNVGPSARELSGVRLVGGIEYTFPLGTFVSPGQRMVLVSDPVAFASKYPRVRIDGVYSRQLANGGERLTLQHVTGAPIFSVQYGAKAPWPVSADGGGFSIVPVNPNLNPAPDNGLNWRASSTVGGSPGVDDPAPNVQPVHVNEILTHTDLPQLDAVELYNPNATAVSIANWSLTDTRGEPLKFRIPAGDARATIPAKGYVVFTEADWNANPTSTNSFRLNSHGEEIYLYSADANGSLTGFSDGFAFGSAENGVTFGRYVNSQGDAQYPAQISNSLGSVNVGPRIGPVVINEILYSPLPGDDAYVELKNITAAPLKLYDPAFPTNTWKVKGLGFSFPANVEIPANGLILLVAGDPNAFRTRHGVAPSIQIFGPFSGTLQKNGETLAVQRPGAPDLDPVTGTYFIPYIDVDVVDYKAQAPWPVVASGSGASLERLRALDYGNDPVDWRASPGAPSPGLENTGNRAPVVNAGVDQSLAVTNVPVTLTLSGTARDDGLPNPLTVTWTQVSGPGTVKFGTATQPATIAIFPALGTYILRLRATDGELESSATITITLSQATVALTFVPKGAVWKYLDNGSDQGSAWNAKAFDDNTWKSGAGELGYGDTSDGRPEVTVVGFGPDGNNKYVTTYFRHAFSVTNAAGVKDLLVNLMRDDGAVVYLNGTEIFRDNMPADAITYQTLAVGAVGGQDEATYYAQTVSPALLVEGINVLAVEIHQANRASSDISFDLELTGEGVLGTPTPVNHAPAVSAGADLSVVLPAAAPLSGSVSDDGLPVPPGQVTVAWSKVSGPGTVTFAPPNALATLANFSLPGSYVLRLTATDGALQSTSDLTVGVLENRAPIVNAGPPITVTLPTAASLQGTASDDGLPSIPGKLSLEWSKVSGPGAVVFSNPGAAATTATFAVSGSYVLRLTGTDGALQTTSDLAVNVLAAVIEPPRIESVQFEPGENPAFHLTFTARPGVVYTVQYSDSLRAGNWTTLSTVPLQAVSQTIRIDDVGVVKSVRRYYRVQAQQP